MSYLNPQNRRWTAYDCSRQSQGSQVMDLQSRRGGSPLVVGATYNEKGIEPPN